MSLAPTLYFLDIKQTYRGYEIWETHCGQEQGCVSTQPEFVDFVHTKSEVQAIVDDWRVNPPCGGKLDDVNWDELPTLPEINKDDLKNPCGRYSDYPEMVLAICELSGIKAYRVVDDEGRLQYFTFEVVE